MIAGGMEGARTCGAPNTAQQSFAVWQAVISVGPPPLLSWPPRVHSAMPVSWRILLADDSIDDQFLVKRALGKVLPAGSLIRTVNSGHRAIAYMAGDGEFSDRERYPFPSLVITDLKMNDGDGFDVLEFLRANPAWSVVPRIVFSSSDDDDDVRSAFLLGASAYHLKGGDLGALEKQFRQILEYWASSKVPPVDKTGRLLKTSNTGRRGARYPQPEGGVKMKHQEDAN